MKSDEIIVVACVVAFSVLVWAGLAGALPGQCSEAGRANTLACSAR